MRKKVLLVNPWIVDFAAYDFWIKPLGLLTVGSILADAGYEILLLDCMDREHPWLQAASLPAKPDGTGHFHKEMVEKPPLYRNIPRHYSRYGLPLDTVAGHLKAIPSPDLICVTSGMTYWYPGVLQMIALLKDQFRQVPVMLGGIYATLCREHAIAHSGADGVLCGSDPGKILALAGQMTGHKSGQPVKQYRYYNDYPSPAYHLYSKLRSAALLTSRGCPHNCPFCASNLLVPSFEMRDPERCVREVQVLAGRGVRNIAFYDDALLSAKVSHIVPFFTTIRSHRYSVAFHTPNGVQPSMIDRDLAILMRESRVETIRLSFESSDPHRQAAMGGKVDCDTFCRAVDHLAEAGYERSKITGYILAGLPGQKNREVVDSIRFVLGRGIRVSLATFSPIPGTKCWSDAESRGLIAATDDPLTANNSVFAILSGQISYEAYTELGTLATTGNRHLLEHHNPLKDSSFLAAAERLADLK